MQVTMRVNRHGGALGLLAAGQTYDVDDALAFELVGAGYAVHVARPALPDFRPDKRSSQIHLPPQGFEVPKLLEGVHAASYGSRVECSKSPEDLIDTTSFARTYYVDGVGGNDSNSGLTWALRKRSIGSAMRDASASGQPSRILVHADIALPYFRQVSTSDDGLVRNSAVPILLEAMNGRVQAGPFDNLTWTKTGGATNTWQATRSNAVHVFNPSMKDQHGIYQRYTWVASSAAVDATEGSWFTDGTTVWVHPHGQEMADIFNARVYLGGTRSLEWQGNQNLFVRGFDFEGGPLGAIRVFGGSTNIIVADDCTFRYAGPQNLNTGGTSVIDGAQILGCGLFAAFNSRADRNTKDGFNLHNEGSVIPSGLFVNCVGTLNGANPSTSNNGFTCHDGVKAMSFGCDWRGNYGAGSGHIDDGTQVWSVGDISGATPGDRPFGGTFESVAFGAWAGNARLWLDRCVDVGAVTGIFSAQGGVVYTRDHRGTGQRIAPVPY
jgi:hypothetical protein